MTTLTLLGALPDLAAWGIVLPSSVLTSGWYQVLAAFVAVNTLAYAALSVSKLVPKLHRRREGRRDGP